ncbi:MAG TPA: hypothetical protein VE465_02785 [Streptosporangiaceae bacterium]|nr:hypothetical protein [Streptosporangiaceae bacterium]
MQDAARGCANAEISCPWASASIPAFLPAARARADTARAVVSRKRYAAQLPLALLG